MGYLRYDTELERALISDLYQNELRLYKNFFQPVMRLKEKVRNGTRLTRRYGRPKTAYQRVLEYPKIAEETKKQLKKRFRKLNPRRLLLDITGLGRKLAKE